MKRGKPRLFSAHEIKLAQHLRSEGHTWREIGRELGCDRKTIWARMVPQLQEKQVERTKRPADSKISAARRAQRDPVETPAFTPLYDPRRDAPLQYRSVSAQILGEPPIGRSALDQKRGMS